LDRKCVQKIEECNIKISNITWYTRQPNNIPISSSCQTAFFINKENCPNYLVEEVKGPPEFSRNYIFPFSQQPNYIFNLNYSEMSKIITGSYFIETEDSQKSSKYIYSYMYHSYPFRNNIDIVRIVDNNNKTITENELIFR
jgi:hypothetical protein